MEVDDKQNDEGYIISNFEQTQVVIEKSQSDNQSPLQTIQGAAEVLNNHQNEMKADNALSERFDAMLFLSQ